MPLFFYQLFSLEASFFASCRRFCVACVVFFVCYVVCVLQLVAVPLFVNFACCCCRFRSCFRFAMWTGIVGNQYKKIFLFFSPIFFSYFINLASTMYPRKRLRFHSSTYLSVPEDSSMPASVIKSGHLFTNENCTKRELVAYLLWVLQCVASHL